MPEILVNINSYINFNIDDIYRTYKMNTKEIKALREHFNIDWESDHSLFFGAPLPDGLCALVIGEKLKSSVFYPRGLASGTC